MTTPSIINIINTGTSANAGNGDSLRTAFTKVNDNFKRLESAFVSAGVTSFNSQTGVVTFTATDISTILGYTPYSDENPLGFVTSSTISLSNYASLDYVNNRFVSTSTLDSRNYITKEYVDGALTEYTTYLYVDNQGFLTPTTLPNFLTGYVTNTQAGITAQLLRDYTTATIYQSISQSNLIPDTAAFYNIGAEDYTWGNLYLGGATYFSGIGVNVDPITARLYVNGNDILAGWTITPTSFYANDLTVRLSATSRPNAQLGDVPSTAGIVLPSDGDSSFQPLTIINTGTVGVTLQGPGASIELRNRVRVIGEIDTPVTFKGTGIINPASGIGRHSLQITPNASFATPPGYPVPFLTQPQTILSTNTATHAPLLIKGRSIGLYASNSLDFDIGTSGESPGLLAVTPLGVIIGSHGGFGFGDYDELAEFGQNYVLPKTKGSTGQVMIQGSGNYLEWANSGAAYVDWENVYSNILPSSDLAYDLGSTSSQWRSLYVGTSTIYLGGTALSIAGNTLAINGEPIQTGGSNTANFAFTSSQVSVSNNSDITLVTNANTWTFGSNGNLTLPSQGKIGPTDVNSFLTFNYGDDVELKAGDNLYLSGSVATIRTSGAVIGQINATSVTVVSSGTNYLGNSTYGTDYPGTLVYVPSGPGPLVSGNFVVQSTEIFTVGDIITIPASIQNNTTATLQVTSTLPYSWSFANTGQLNLPQASNGTARIQSVADIDILSGNSLWTFDTNGVLTLPSGNTRIGDISGGGFQDFIIGSTGTLLGVVVHGQSGAGALQWVDNFENLGTTSTEVAAVIVNSPFASTTGTVQILTGISNGFGSSNTWEFGADGNLTIPDDIQDANGSVVRVATTSTAPTRVNGQLWFDNQEGRLYIKNDGVWLDASPTQIPSPETYLDGLAIDGTVIGTANVDGDAIVIDGGDNTKLTVSNNSVTIQVPGSGVIRPYWAAEFGGITTAVTTSSYTVGTGAFYDSQGNVYVLGGVQFDTNEMFGLDSLLLKYDTNGNLLWSRTWHDDSGANCGAVNQAFAIDSNDRIYWLATALDPTFGCWTGYMDTEGNLGLGGVAQASLGFIDGAFAGVDIACDNSGNYYLAGAFYDGNEIPAVIKVDGDSGVPIWTGSIVPEDFESLPSNGVYRAVTVNPATGDVWAIGDYNDGGLRAMLSKWDINGSHQWTKELVTVTGDVAAAVIYNGGYVYTIVNDDPDQKAVVSKFDTDGVLIWASFLAVGELDPIPNNFGDYNTGAYDLSFDATGNVYVTGTIPGPPAGQPQLWITKLNPTNGEMLYSRMLATNAGLLIFDNFSFGFGASGHRVGDIYQDTIVVTAVTESDIDDNTGTNAGRVMVAQLPIDGSVTGTFDNIDIIDITSDIDGICSTGTYTVTTLVWSTGTSTAITSTSSISVSTVTDVVGLTGETIALGSGTAGGTTTTNTWTFVNNNIILPPGGDILDSYGNSVLGDRYIALPNWITVVADTEHLPTLNTDYGWDSSGAWSTNATILGVEEPEGTSFPFRTTFSIPNDTKSVTTVDFVVNDLEESDFGITVFASGTTPTWVWEGSGSSIDAKYTPTELNGISGGAGGGEGWIPPSLGTYRARLTVDPTGTGTAAIELVTMDTSNNVLDTITYTETSFFNTSYKIGFASDNDGGVNKTYFKNLTININNGATVYTDTLMNGNSVGGSTTALGDRLTAGSNSVVLSSTGTLTLPNGGVISEVGGAFGGAIRLEPSGASSSTQALVIYPTAGVDGNHIHLTAGGGGTDLYLGDDDQYVKVDHSGTIVVGTLGANTSTWTFGTDGVLTLSTASVILGNSTDPNVYIETLTTSTTNTWTFAADGSTTLPIGVSIDEYNGSHFPRIVADTGKAFSLQGYGSTGSVALQWAETASTSSQIAQVGLNKFGDGLAKVVLTAGTSTNDMKVWEFAADGKLTLPGALVKSTVAKTGVILPTTTGIPNALGGSMTGLSLANGMYGPVTIGSVTFSVTVASGSITSFFDISSTSSYAVNATIGQLTSEDLGDSPGQTTNIGVDSVVQETPTAVDLTKSVNKLTNGDYTLADGVEGQIMYLVRQTGSTAHNVTVANVRLDGTVYTDVSFTPFTDGTDPTNMVTLIFTDSAWQSMGGVWNFT